MLGTFGPGDMVDFSGFPGGGVTQFTVSGIGPTVDGNDPLAFPTFLQFDQSTVNFTMTPVPEPSSFTLALISQLTLLSLKRRFRV